MEFRTVKRAKRSQRGMSLIEVMFAVGVLAFSFSVVYGSLVSMYMLNLINEDRVKAVASVSSMLEEINSLSFNSLTSYTAPRLQGPGVRHWVNVDAVAEDGATISLPIGAGATGGLPNPCEVRVTMHWYDPTGREYEYSASTMKYQ